MNPTHPQARAMVSTLLGEAAAVSSPSGSQFVHIGGDEVKFECGADNEDLDVYRSAAHCREMLEHFAEQKGVVTLVFVCPPPQIVTTLADVMTEMADAAPLRRRARRHLAPPGYRQQRRLLLRRV